MRGVAFAFSVCLLSACGLFRPVHPQIGVELSSDDGRVTFRFSDCLGRAKLPINEVAIYANNDGPEGRPPLCRLQVLPRRYGQIALTSWRYGDDVEGYRPGACKTPLAAGNYSVHVLGSGVGVRRFVLDQGGRARPMGEKCL